MAARGGDGRCSCSQKHRKIIVVRSDIVNQEKHKQQSTPLTFNNPTQREESVVVVKDGDDSGGGCDRKHRQGCFC